MPYLEEAFRVLLGNKVRSLLTLTGLIIGVAAVIAIQVLGNGMAGAVSGALGTLNDHAFILFPNTQQGDFRRAAIRLSELDDIKATVPGVVEALPAGQTRDLVHVGHAQYRLGVYGDSDQRFNIVPFSQGAAFTPEDVSAKAKVCILTDAAYKKLFPDGGDALGKSIYVGNSRFVVVGVQAPPRTGILNATFGGDVAIPYTAYIAKYIRGGTIFAARFVLSDDAPLAETEAAVIKRLRELHKNDKSAQYQTFDKASFASGIGSIFGAMTMIVGLIGAVSLLVAGIGIMNIMLVSVTERTREIGVRKAIGATRTQILAQFFIEALALSTVGCLIGLVIGLAIGWAVNTYAIVKITGTIAPIPWVQATIIAVGFATVVTLAFGTYPAYRAAGLDPIEALRYE
ncbi:MAG TPA: ABC transporter permease [Candidatus Baltobacteraceae bacterium]|jgi:putative ABC transport system permease protein